MQAIQILSALAQHNLEGVRAFKTSSILIKPLAVALFLLTLAGSAHAIDLPSAPTVTQQHTFGAIDYSLAIATVAGRAGDYFTTQNCIKHPWCTERELPNSLVHNQVAFAGFEIGAAAGSLLLQRYEIHHGHRLMARITQSVNVSLLAGVSAHNQMLADRAH